MSVDEPEALKPYNSVYQKTQTMKKVVERKDTREELMSQDSTSIGLSTSRELHITFDESFWEPRSQTSKNELWAEGQNFVFPSSGRLSFLRNERRRTVFEY